MIFHGLDGWRQITSPDPVDGLLARAVIDRLKEHRERDHDELALAVVERLAESTNR